MDILLTGFRFNEYFTTWTRGYIAFIMHTSTEHEIWIVYSTKLLKDKDFSYFKTLRWYIYPANKYWNANIWGILPFMNTRNFMLSCIEHGKVL